MTDQKKQTIVMKRVAEKLVKGLRTQIPEKGIFKSYGFTFDVFGTEIMAYLAAIHEQTV